MPDGATSKGALPEAERGTGGFLHPERIVGRLDLRPGMRVADFGSGGGYFAVPAARLVGENGKVWAIDIQKQSLDLIRSRANLEHLLNIETVWADLEQPGGSHLPDDAADVVIMSNVLFQSQARREVLAEARRVLRTGGRLAVLEWDETPFPAGPAMNFRVPKSSVRTLAEGVGFTLEKEFEAGSHHYGLLFTKK